MENCKANRSTRGLLIKYSGALAIILILILVNFSYIINIERNIDNNYINIQTHDNSDSTLVQDSMQLAFKPEFTKVNFGEKVWDFVKVEDCIYNTNPGQPRIPIKVLELKTRSEITDLEVNYYNPEYISELQLAPAPVVQIWTADYTSSPDLFFDDEYYNTDEYLPSLDFELNPIGTKHDNGDEYYLYNLKLYPLKYNPVSSSGIFYDYVEVQFEYELEPYAIQGTRTTRNVDHLDRAPANSYKYLIITTSDLVDELQPLVNWKTQKGLPAKMKTVSEITSDPLFDGKDDPDELRNYIQWAYDQWEIEYVLLAGDYNTVPTRHTYDAQAVYTGDDGIIPADTYYACIDEGTTWNTDDDSNYGEFGELDDIIPDIAVGRIAINSEPGMANWVIENIAYEKSPPSGDWVDTITLVADYGFAVGDCADQADFLFNSYFDSVYDSYSKLYDDNSGTDHISSSKIQEKINNGTALVVYTDHANTNAWGSTMSFTNAHAAALTNNDKKPVVYVMACLSAGFDHTSLESLGEAFTENAGGGAIAYIGSTRVAVGAVGTAYSYEPTATGLEEDFARKLKDAQVSDPSQLRVGLVHKNALERYATSWGDQFPGGSVNNFAQRSWLLLTLLGDPDSPIWTETPRSFQITNSTEKLGDNVEVTIQVTDTVDLDTGIENVRVAISSGTDAYDFGHTDSAGKVMFIITNPAVEELDVTITKPNFIPHEDIVKLVDYFPPITTYDITPSGPDGNYGWYCTTPTLDLNTEPLATTYYRWDEGAEKIYTSTLTVPEGDHTLYYYSVDTEDNIEQESSMSVRVDTIAPTTFYNITPELPDGENGWYVTFPTINFTTDVNLSSESNVTSYYHWDLDNDSVYVNEFQAFEGEHTLYYHSVDGAGNNETEKSLEFKIDTITPHTNLTTTPSVPDGNDSWYLTVPTVNLSLNRSGGAEEVQTSFFYGWDNVSFTLFTDLLLPPNGNNTLYYYAVDQAGNQEPGQTNIYKIDTEYPETILDITLPVPDGDNGWYRTSTNITISTYEPIIGFENCSTEIIYYHWDSEPNEIYNGSNTLNLSEGIHKLYYHSIDIAGNIEPEQFIEFKLDSILPVTALNITPQHPDNLNGWYLAKPLIELDTEPNERTYYHWDDQTYQTYNGSLLTPEEGLHTIFYYSVDEAGNIELERSQEFKIDLYRPIPALSINITKIYINEDIIFDGSGSSDFNGVGEYYFDFDDGNSSGWTEEPIISYNYSEPGIYDVTLKVRDTSGSISTKRVNFTVTVNRKPKKSDDEGWQFLPDDMASFSIMLGLIILIVIIILIAAAGYLGKRRRYPVARATYLSGARRSPSRSQYHYEEDLAVEPEIIWDERPYHKEEPLYEEDHYYDEDYSKPYEEEEYWDEEYEPEEEYYEEDYHETKTAYEDEDVDWGTEDDEDDEDDVDWDAEDEDEDEDYWDEQEYDEPEEDHYDDRRTRRFDRDEYGDHDRYDEHYRRDEDYYNTPPPRGRTHTHHSVRSGRPRSPPARRRGKRLAPTWRSQQYKRRRPGLLDTEDANIGEFDEDNVDEF